PSGRRTRSTAVAPLYPERRDTPCTPAESATRKRADTEEGEAARVPTVRVHVGLPLCTQSRVTRQHGSRCLVIVVGIALLLSDIGSLILALSGAIQCVPLTR